MDSEDKMMEAELLAKEVKRRSELLRMAKGGWKCWGGFEIAIFIIIAVVVAFLISPVFLAAVSLLVAVYENLVGK